MEYFAGSIITLVITFAFLFPFRHLAMPQKPIPIKVSQSRAFSLIAPFIIYTNKNYNIDEIETQSMKHLSSRYMRIVFFEDYAYWIKDSVFYTAPVINGEVQTEHENIVDTINMDKVQLDNISFIVEKLSEGSKDDRGNSRK